MKIRRSLINTCLVIVLVVFVFSFLNLPLVHAKLNEYGFEDHMRYDIYFYNGEYSTAVIKNVDIEGFREIAGRTFLVIKSHEFKLKQTEGFILFESITAILPGGNFRVHTSRKKIRF